MLESSAKLGKSNQNPHAYCVKISVCIVLWATTASAAAYFIQDTYFISQVPFLLFAENK